MPREQSQAAIHCPHAYTRGSKPNIRYSKSIHATAHPYRQLERAPWLGHAPMCERSSRNRARLCDRCALHAAHHRTQVGADTTTAHKTGAKLKAQGAQELRSDLSLTTHCTTKTTILTTPGRTMAVFLDTQTYRNIGSNFNHGAGPTEAQGHGL